jgi:hypothetical protein
MGKIQTDLEKIFKLRKAMHLDAKIRGDESSVKVFDSTSSFSPILINIIQQTECISPQSDIQRFDALFNIIVNHTGFDRGYIVKIFKYHRHLRAERVDKQVGVVSNNSIRITPMENHKYKTFIKDRYNNVNANGAIHYHLGGYTHTAKDKERPVIVVTEGMTKAKFGAGKKAFLQKRVIKEVEFDFISLSIGWRD